MVARATCNISGGPVVSLHIVLAITGGVLTQQSAASDADSTEFDDRFAAARPRLIAICTGLVGADAAQDVVQDTYLRARSRWQQLRDPTAFDAWLVRIAINLAHNHQRRARGLQARIPRLFRAQVSPTSGDIGLRELVERLPARERSVLVLHYAHGYSLDEIAQLLELTPTNVRTIIFRTRRRLAEQWREAPP